MKAYTSVPRDLTRVKEKFIFNLTKRQLVCFGMAAIIGLPSYFFIKKVADSTAATLCMVLIMVPLFLVAMYEKNGQPLEVILKNFVQAKFFREKERPYKTNNKYAVQKSKMPENEKNTGNPIERLKNRMKKDSPQTAQQSIPYQKMYPDGVCKVTDHYYSKTIMFQDRNYQLLKEEDKELILDDWGDLLKLFGNSVQFELSYLSLPEDMDVLKNKLYIPYRFDGLDKLRTEHSEMLLKHVVDGSKGKESLLSNLLRNLSKR